jgi:chromosomal replication initiator protein
MNRAQAEAIARDVAERCGVTVEDIFGDSRTASVARARRWSMALCRLKFGWSFPELGKVFGRDHSTCLTTVRKAMREFGEEAPEPELRKVVGLLR